MIDFNMINDSVIREPVARPHLQLKVWGEVPQPDSQDYTITPDGKYVPSSEDLPLIISRMVLEVLYKQNGVNLLRGLFVKNQKINLYKWTGNCYLNVEIPAIKNEIQTFLTDECRVEKRSSPKKKDDFDDDIFDDDDNEEEKVIYVPFPAKEAMVGHVYTSICRQVMADKASDREVAWLGDDNPPADPADLIFAKNCIIDVKKGCVIPSSPNWFNTTTLSCNYDPKTKQKLTNYLKYEKRLTDGDPKKIKLLRQFCGLCLIDNVKLQKGLLIIGPPNTGKSVLGILLSGILTKPNMFGLDSCDFSHHFGLEEAIGKKLALLSDCQFTSSRSIHNAVETIKKLIAADPMPIKRKYKSADTLRLHTRVLMISNDVPQLPDRTGAIRRRFSVLNVPDSAVLQSHEVDIELSQKMLQQESEAILNIWVAAVVELMHMPVPILSKPDDENEILDQLSQLSNHCHQFIQDYCDKTVGVDLDADTAYTAYIRWCEAIGETPESRSEFISLMEGCGVKVKRRNYDLQGKHCNNFIRFIGISLKPE